MAATMQVYVVIPDNDRPKSVSRITVRTTPVSPGYLAGRNRNCALLPQTSASRLRGRSPGGTRNTRTTRSKGCRTQPELSAGSTTDLDQRVPNYGANVT